MRINLDGTGHGQYNNANMPNIKVGIVMNNEYMIIRFSKNGQEPDISIELLPEPEKSCYAGDIWFLPERNEEDAMFVFVDDSIHDDGIRGCFATKIDNWTIPAIVMDSETFFGFLHGSDVYKFKIFHEIGHYRLGHLDVQTDIDQEFEERKRLLKEHKVYQAELDADRFAASYVGVDVSIDALTEAQENRMTHDIVDGSFGSELSTLALREFDLRIQALEDLE